MDRERVHLGRGLNSIGNKMLAVLVAVAVLPAVTVSLYALRQTTDALAAQALTLLSEASTTDARHARDLLITVQEDLRARAGNPEVKTLFKTLPATHGGEVPSVGDKSWSEIESSAITAEQDLRALFERHPSCRHAYALWRGSSTTGGTPMLALTRRGGDVAIAPMLERDAQGYLKLLPFSDGDAAAAYERIRAAFQLASEEQPNRAELRDRLDATSGEALEIFAAKVSDPYKPEYGWLVLALSWRAILEELRAGADAETAGITSLYDAQLRPVETSRPGSWAEIPDKPAAFKLKESARDGQAAAALLESGNIVAFAPLLPRLDDASERLVLAFERPQSELMQNVRRFRVVFASVLAAALLLAGLFGTWLARRLTRPLRVLRDGATQIGQGDLDQTLEVRTGDEAEALAHEFNAMAGKLRSLYHGMEETIRERTEQLQTALDGLRVAHKEIVESEKRYSDIVENASDLIQVTDAAGRIVAANRRQAELFGVDVEALKGRDFFDWVAPEAREPTRRAFATVLAGKPLRAFESVLVVGAEERQLPVEISANPVLRDGAADGVRAILRDVSERKEIEARLIKAERLSSVGALAAGVAHEINNPLGIITMFAQRVLERARKGEVDAEKLEKIVEQGKRVAAITRNLLDFARAAPTRFAAFSISEAIQSTCALVEDRARQASITLRREIAHDLPPVAGNSHQITQVMLNLLLNAFQAIGRDGTVTVRAQAIDASRIPTGGRAVRVTVEDSGPGIPADVLPRLFEPFFTTKGPGEGTGLGLSVSYGILKEHHGAISAANRSGGGASFEFDLPVEAASGAAAPGLDAGAMSRSRG